MGRHFSYKAGSYYRTDDISGFPQRAERTQKMWNNLYATGTIWNPRQPQDLVKGVKDNQAVWDARPLPPNQFVGPIWTTTSEFLPVGSIYIEVESLAGFTAGDKGAIMLGSGDVFLATILYSGLSPSPLFSEDGTPLQNEDGSILYTEGAAGTPILTFDRPIPEAAVNGTQVWNYGPIAVGTELLVSDEQML